MENLKNKVESKLLKWGNNSGVVKEMIDLHFEYASKTYKNVNSIAECITRIY